MEGPCNKPAMLASLLHSISFLACLRLTLLHHRIIIDLVVVLQARVARMPTNLVGYTIPPTTTTTITSFYLH